MENFKRGLLLVGLLVVTSLFLFSSTRSSEIEGYECQSAPENAFVLSPGAMCKGSPYLYSGDDAFSRMCQSLQETKEGRQELKRYNCNSQFDGIPRSFPTYSAHTNSLWQDLDGSPAGV